MNFYPRPPGGGRPDDFIAWATLAHISIHALRVEGDITVLEETAEEAISIHALRVEGDAISKGFILLSGFLSTPSGWRATNHIVSGCTVKYISIHALRVEGDQRAFLASIKPSLFLSTPSGWRATGDHTVFQRGSVNFYPRPPGGGRQQKRTKFSSVFAQKGEEFASLRHGKRKICRWRFKKDKFWGLIWCEGSGKSVYALASHCG